ncbi:MAG: MCE family protein [Gammaproteobacteria bacterium]|nr:MCE family protein [Gammaproteobacteria bacterium]NIR98399.1 MCE family protein [Gammaproteobacteria bacterium]NIT64153.1 MCE family protein [Gammaproteobacteria bacterium]NIV21090.1 MCE family protein [Gammaproteobacteria bacterium]NIY32733.1 MCE family protein [Gammaproteobacteria bacterium]
MRKDNVNYLAVGIFVLAMFVLLMATLYRVTGREGETEPYFVTYTNIQGVRAGTVVTYGGYQIGQVERVIPVREAGETHFRLRLAITEGWKIPRDSVARIVSPGMLSDNLIDVEEGETDRYLAPGDHMQGQEEVSAMTLLNDMAYELKTLSDQSIRPLLENLNRQVEAIGSELGAQIPKITANASALLEELRQSASGLSSLFSDENRAHVSGMMKNAEQITENLAQLSGQFGRVRDKLDRLLDNSNQLLAENRDDLRTTVVALRQSLDMVSRSIDSIVYNLETASRNMSEFSREIRRNPGLLLGGTPPPEREAPHQ